MCIGTLIFVCVMKETLHKTLTKGEKLQDMEQNIMTMTKEIISVQVRYGYDQISEFPHR